MQSDQGLKKIGIYKGETISDENMHKQIEEIVNYKIKEKLDDLMNMTYNDVMTELEPRLIEDKGKVNELKKTIDIIYNELSNINKDELIYKIDLIMKQNTSALLYAQKTDENYEYFQQNFKNFQNVYSIEKANMFNEKFSMLCDEGISLIENLINKEINHNSICCEQDNQINQVIDAINLSINEIKSSGNVFNDLKICNNGNIINYKEYADTCFKALDSLNKIKNDTLGFDNSLNISSNQNGCNRFDLNQISF